MRSEGEALQGDREITDHASDFTIGVAEDLWQHFPDLPRADERGDHIGLHLPLHVASSLVVSGPRRR